MTNTTLLPCPFCGGEAEMIESDYGMYLTGYAVYCHKCCLKMGVTGRLGETYEWTPVFNTEAEAIDAWNTRAERTCTVEKFQQNPSYGDYYCELSCGHWFDVVDDMPPAYCLICGAKVVDE